MDVDGLLREAKAAGIGVDDFTTGHVRSAILAVVAARLCTRPMPVYAGTSLLTALSTLAFICFSSIFFTP